MSAWFNSHSGGPTTASVLKNISPILMNFTKPTFPSLLLLLSALKLDSLPRTGTHPKFPFNHATNSPIHILLPDSIFTLFTEITAGIEDQIRSSNGFPVIGFTFLCPPFQKPALLPSAPNRRLFCGPPLPSASCTRLVWSSIEEVARNFL